LGLRPRFTSRTPDSDDDSVHALPEAELARPGSIGGVGHLSGRSSFRGRSIRSRKEVCIFVSERASTASLKRQLRFDWQGSTLLSATQINTLRSLLLGRRIVVCFGAGVDSTALLVVLWLAAIRPNLITFADTGGEKPETYVHLVRMNEVLRGWEWPEIVVCRKNTKESTPYVTLQGECLANETLPAIAFGMKSCSMKWKQEPQDQYLMGVKSGPNARAPHSLWLESQLSGSRIVK